ncbi:HK97 family phage prohead protease [Azospirillum agricola]|uniref:HK97 family phage prohead protease n=1 Tax=Azospirillum agricola TaxID=1720247 RepID=UPI001AE30DD1|nr:HK97 family phage prohead protease [Azospirillum agricola]MBP2233091.1 HK97 family phage prohead protease [Azospirillum agricola]
MDLKRKFIGGTVTSGDGLGPRQVRVVISAGTVDRAGDVVVQKGIGFDNYQKNPVVLWNHKKDFPVGNAIELIPKGDLTEALVEFFPEGVDETADRICRMVKSGGIKGVSIGFDPLEAKPRKDGGVEFTRCDLMEFSFVTIPCHADALVVERALDAGVWGRPAVLRVPAELSKDAVAQIRKDWLEARASGGLFIVGRDWQLEDDGLVTKQLVTRDAPKLAVKGLYDVASLANLLSSLGYIHSNADWEADYEGDGSAVPGMLADAMRQLGEALIAMTAEEVSELLAKAGGEKAATAAQLKSFGAIVKAGRTLSAASEADIKAVVDLIGATKASTTPAAPDDAADADAAAREERERRVKAMRLSID